jgi:hypothetical protein
MQQMMSDDINNKINMPVMNINQFCKLYDCYESGGLKFSFILKSATPETIREMEKYFEDKKQREYKRVREMSVVDKYVTLLNIINRFFVINNLPQIYMLTEFREVRKDLLMNVNNTKAIESSEHEIFKCYSKIDYEWEIKKKNKSYLLKFICKACCVVGFDTLVSMKRVGERHVRCYTIIEASYLAIKN